jgi:hypothetical protein
MTRERIIRPPLVPRIYLPRHPRVHRAIRDYLRARMMERDPKDIIEVLL